MSGLTEDQQLVADSDGHTMCCALPGSGKSHTIVALTGNLLKKNPQYRVLLITFTNAAAAELNERLAASLPPKDVHRAFAATFDAIYGRQVREFANTKKRTLVGGEQINFIERAMRHAGLSGMEIDEAMEWVDTYGRMIKPEPINDEWGSPGWQIFKAYSDLMVRNNMQDFNQVAREAYLGVQTGRIPPWPATHILVDEFQDTSDMQYAWIQVHGEMGAKIVVVGDDDQSIYSWRGAAGYQNMVNFQNDFGATGYVLRLCFRCRPEILEGARRVIEYNEDRVYKEMFSAREPGGVVKIKGFLTVAEEFEAMIHAITSDNREWAILARTNRILDEAEGYLKMHNIPYKRLGGKKLWDDQTANVMLKFLWSLVRPRDTRFIGELLGWLGEDEEVIHVIETHLVQKRCAFGDFMPPAWLDWHKNIETLHENWMEWGSDTSTKGQLTDRMKNIVDYIKSVRGDKGRQAKIVELVGDILQGLNVDGGFVDRVEMLAKNLAPSPKNAEEEQNEKGVVTLASLHSSKGLQWSQVWIAASSQGVCPSQNALDAESTGGVPEERRLYYVGMTRAVDELYMSFAYNPKPQGTAVRTKPPSQFLCEGFPDEMTAIMEDLNARAEEALGKGEEECGEAC